MGQLAEKPGMQKLTVACRLLSNRRASLLHFAPDDTDLPTTLTNGFLQNVCHRYLLGYETYFNFNAESNIQMIFMHYPQFKQYDRPTMREANDRVMYLANNWQKLHTGNEIYGRITYVINPIYQDKFFVAPFDTGEYAWKVSNVPFGSLENMWHLIKVGWVIICVGTV